MSPPGWFRVHDGFLSDEKLAALIEQKRHDAVVLYFATIAWSHARDSDGRLNMAARRVLARHANVDEGAFEALIEVGLVSAVRTRGASPIYQIGGYGKWQTSSDQRKQHAETMRKYRSRDPNVNGRTVPSQTDHVIDLDTHRDS